MAEVRQEQYHHRRHRWFIAKWQDLGRHTGVKIHINGDGHDDNNQQVGNAKHGTR